MPSHVMEVNVPRSSLVERALAPVHYADAFVVQFERGRYASVDVLARAVTKLPRAGVMLMAVRDAIVSVFGLKTVPDSAPSAPDAPIRAGGVVGMFQVLSRSEEEIVMGLDDKHLDFRFSVLLRPDVGGDQAVATTLVRFRNRWGRLYFAVVKPFHRLLIPAMLGHALAESLSQQSG